MVQIAAPPGYVPQQVPSQHESVEQPAPTKEPAAHQEPAPNSESKPKQDVGPEKEIQPEPQPENLERAKSSPSAKATAAKNLVSADPETVEDLGATENIGSSVSSPQEESAAEQPSSVATEEAAADNLFGDAADSLDSAHEPAVAGAEAQSDEVYGGPVLPTDDWTSSGTKVLQQRALLVAGAVAGVGLLAITIMGINSWLNQPEVVVEAPVEPVEPHVPIAPTPNVDDTNPDPNPVAPAPVDPPPDVIVEAPGIPAAPGIESDPPSITPENPAIDPPIANPPIANPPITVPPATDPPAESNPNGLPNVITVPPKEIGNDPTDDPLDPPIDDGPPGFVDEPRINGEPEKPTSQSALDELLERFAPYLDNTPVNNDVAVDPVDEPADPNEGQMSAEIRPRPEPRAIDITARLADSIPAIEMRNMPLADVLQFVSDFSTIPITLDTDSLRWIGKTPETGLTIQATDITVEEILEKGLVPEKLAVLALEDQLVVTRFSKFHGALRLVTHRVTDVAATQEELAELKKWISQLVAPNTWKENGGEATIEMGDQTLIVSQTEHQQFKILFLLESLRQSRGLPLRTSFPKAMFARKSRYSRGKARLEQTVSINYGQATPLLKIVSKLQKSTGTRILINWQSTMKIGWTPDSMGSVSAQDATLDATLTELLKPMKLGYRVVDERTVEIMSSNDLKEQLELEVYDISEFVAAGETPAAIIDRFGKMIGAHLLQKNGGVGTLIYDAKSNSLLASLPHPQQVMLQRTMDNRPAAK
jgi:hypothetical protein